MFRTLPTSFLFLGLACFLTGCISSEPPKPANTDHDHDEHIHGPHNGPVVEVGKHEYFFEWLHEGESGLVTIYFVDHEGKKEVPIEAPHVTITITTKKADGDTKVPYDLLAVDPTMDGKAAKFELADKNLENALDLLSPGGVEAELSFTDGAKKKSAAIERDDHH